MRKKKNEEGKKDNKNGKKTKKFSLVKAILLTMLCWESLLLQV